MLSFEEIKYHEEKQRKRESTVNGLVSKIVSVSSLKQFCFFFLFSFLIKHNVLFLFSTASRKYMVIGPLFFLILSTEVLHSPSCYGLLFS